MDYAVYTDGACAGNPGPGGWAAIVISVGQPRTHCAEEFSGGDSHTTNNQMELQAAIEGLRAIPQSSRVTVYSDSKYVILGMTQWIANWKRKGWVSSSGAAVANRELWETLYAESQHRTVTWQWVKGHAANEFNNMADKLAVAERNRYASR